MSCTIKPVFKALSIANGCQFSLPAIFSTKTSHPYLSIPLPSQPIKLRLSFSISSSPTSSFTVNKTNHTSTVAAFAAQTDWTQQGTNTDVTEDEDEDEEPGADAIGDAGESGGEVGFEEGEESYPEPPEEAKVYVGNLDYGVDSETLAQVFEQAGVVEIAEVKYNRQTDQSQGFAFVTMRTVEEADKAIEMFHRYDLNGRLLVVNKAAPIGTRPERQERPPRTTEPTYSAFVSNFPWDTDDEHLEQLFSKHGKVLDARVVYDRESGRSRGFGFVKMSTEAELNDAIANLHGQSVGGREIRVHPAGEKPRQSF